MLFLLAVVLVPAIPVLLSTFFDIIPVPYDVNTLKDFLIVVWGTLGVLEILAISFLIGSKLGSFQRNYISGKTKVDKRPNIVLEYIKAKKEKVCPMIEFEDEEK